MKKFLIGLLIGSLIMLTITVFSADDIKEARLNDEIELQVDGKTVDTDILTVILKGDKDSRYFVPFQDLAEAMGGNVKWDEKNKIIKVTTQQADTVEVVRVIDGDTFEIKGGKRVRLIGVDTPESVHPDKTKNTEFGKSASEFTKKAIEGKTVKLIKDVSETDRYGRLLRYVYLEDGTFFNELLVKEGYAKVSTYPPDVKFADLFVEAQKYAMENNKGLWAYSEETEENVETEEKPEQISKENYLFVGSKSSDKYHKPTCRWAKEITDNNLITFESKDKAEAAGYKPCGVCKP